MSAPHLPDPGLLFGRTPNRQRVLGFIRSAGQIGRAELARKAGMSTQAVSKIVEDLEGQSLILKADRVAKGRGLPVVKYALNPEAGFTLGFEIRPDLLIWTASDLLSNKRAGARLPLENNGPVAVARHMQTALTTLQKHHAIERRKVLGAGIVMPGPFGLTGIANKGTELTGWDSTNPRTFARETLQMPVLIENDANAAAIAETFRMPNLTSYACLYFGSGLGLGIVNNGALVRGAHGNAGELGHIALPGGGELEQSVSRVSVARWLGARGVQAGSGEDLAHLFAARNPALMEWIDQAIPALSFAVQMVENMLDPETILLAGAMPKPILEHLLSRLQLPESSVAHRPERPLPRVMCGACGPSTAADGAASLVLNSLFTPPSEPGAFS